MARVPMAIDRIDRVRGEGDSVRLSLTGHWLTDARADQGDPLLVVELRGRRHRFTALRDAGSPAPPEGIWAATFSLPLWAEPTRPGQAALWLGDIALAVPVAGEDGAPVAPAAPAAPAPAPAAAAAPPPPAAAEVPPQPRPAPEPSRLEHLVDVEAAQTALRDELAEVLTAIGSERGEYERRLAEIQAERDALAARAAEAQVSRDVAAGETVGLRAELDRIGSELAVTREQLGAQGGDLGEAERLLEEARALSDQLRSGNPQ
jgi:hypothetical protein